MCVCVCVWVHVCMCVYMIVIYKTNYSIILLIINNYYDEWKYYCPPLERTVLITIASLLRHIFVR